MNISFPMSNWFCCVYLAFVWIFPASVSISLLFLPLDDRQDRAIPFFPMDFRGDTIGCICLRSLVHPCVCARLCLLHSCCFGPSFSFGSEQLVSCRRKPGCVWRFYLGYCSRWEQQRWDCTKLGSELSARSSIAVPTSPQPLCALMVCRACPQHHVTITLPSLLFLLALQMEKMGEGEKKKSDVLGLQGQQRRLEISAEHSHLCCWPRAAGALCSPAWGECLGRTPSEGGMLPPNQIPFPDNQTFPLMSIGSLQCT